jgi:hypothetical protein
MDIRSDYRLWPAVIMDLVLNDGSRNTVTGNEVRVGRRHFERIRMTRRELCIGRWPGLTLCSVNLLSWS